MECIFKLFENGKLFKFKVALHFIHTTKIFQHNKKKLWEFDFTELLSTKINTQWLRIQLAVGEDFSKFQPNEFF